MIEAATVSVFLSLNKLAAPRYADVPTPSRTVDNVTKD